jgi:hypothetical protein
VGLPDEPQLHLKLVSDHAEGAHIDQASSAPVEEVGSSWHHCYAQTYRSQVAVAPEERHHERELLLKTHDAAVGA